MLFDTILPTNRNEQHSNRHCLYHKKMHMDPTHKPTQHDTRMPQHSYLLKELKRHQLQMQVDVSEGALHVPITGQGTYYSSPPS